MGAFRKADGSTQALPPPLVFLLVLTLQREQNINHDTFLPVFINAAPNLQTRHPVFSQSAALSLTASHDPRGGLLEDTGVSCCEAAATYVCTTWLP